MPNEILYLFVPSLAFTAHGNPYDEGLLSGPLRSPKGTQGHYNFNVHVIPTLMLIACILFVRISVARKKDNY